ncbi:MULTISPECIES: hypothetical protein [unclassified Stappia]|uniref:hypothetical protein n=1 Tax=unclassified Stappia TaxID=2629676 RepID=UPI001643D074|nr:MULTISPECIES: hypothetical protein [unclassified Stappia]
MSFTDRSQNDEKAGAYADMLTSAKPSPWPIALRVTSAALLLTLIICYAFPNG